MSQTRTEKRAQFTDATRIVLLEEDMDEMEDGYNGVQKELKRSARLLVTTLTSLIVGLIVVIAQLAAASG